MTSTKAPNQLVLRDQVDKPVYQIGKGTGGRLWARIGEFRVRQESLRLRALAAAAPNGPSSSRGRDATHLAALPYAVCRLNRN